MPVYNNTSARTTTCMGAGLHSACSFACMAALMRCMSSRSRVGCMDGVHAGEVAWCVMHKLTQGKKKKRAASVSTRWKDNIWGPDSKTESNQEINLRPLWKHISRKGTVSLERSQEAMNSQDRANVLSQRQAERGIIRRFHLDQNQHVIRVYFYSEFLLSI